ncbi:MAG: DUF1287 domain-containing protein [Bacillota bacterium]
MGKCWIWATGIIILASGLVMGEEFRNKIFSQAQFLYHLGNRGLNNLVTGMTGDPECNLPIPRIYVNHDEDSDGIWDADDLVAGARRDAARRPRYKDAYYRGGYPPDNEGVCTDVIWRAFREAGYNLKAMVDRDIQANRREYPRVDRPDPNIDFRRVLNLHVFMRRHARALTCRLIPNNIANLQEWQGGDIVIFGSPYNHIAIVSDRRRQDGVPLIIHNRSPYTMEEDALLYWHHQVSPIIGHYRWEKKPAL